MARKISYGSRVFLFAAIVAAGCDRESRTAGIDGTGVRSPVAAFSYGRVASFGSVWVNGVRYDTSGATFTINGGPGSLADLDVGDVVLVVGRFDPETSEGQADRVIFDHVLEGPIGAIDASEGLVIALEQTIKIEADTSFDATVGPARLAGLSVGDVINVSGFRNAGGAIVATRIGRQPLGTGPFKTTGAVTRVAEDDQRFNVSALVVDHSGAQLLGDVAHRAIANGDVVEVEGMLGAAGELVAARVEFKSRGLFGNPGDRADVEGYITAFDVGSPLSFEVAGLAVAASSSTVFEGSLALDVPVEVKGSLDSSGVLIASDVRTGFVPRVGPHTIEGQVFDPYSGVVAGASINLWVQGAGAGYSYWWAHGPLHSDEAGRFSAPSLPEAQITILAFKDGFVQPCAVILDLRESVAVNVEMAAESTLSAPNPPQPQSAQAPTLTGIVYETTDVGRQPVEGARLWAEHLLEVGAATSVTDPDGAYFLCNLPQRLALWVTKPGFSDTVIWQVDTSQSSVLDIEMKRR